MLQYIFYSFCDFDLNYFVNKLQQNFRTWIKIVQIVTCEDDTQQIITA